jgi:hypothetical protein
VGAAGRHRVPGPAWSKQYRSVACCLTSLAPLRDGGGASSSCTTRCTTSRHSGGAQLRLCRIGARGLRAVAEISPKDDAASVRRRLWSANEHRRAVDLSPALNRCRPGDRCAHGAVGDPGRPRDLSAVVRSCDPDGCPSAGPGTAAGRPSLPAVAGVRRRAGRQHGVATHSGCRPPAVTWGSRSLCSQWRTCARSACPPGVRPDGRRDAGDEVASGRSVLGPSAVVPGHLTVGLPSGRHGCSGATCRSAATRPPRC